MPGLWNTDTAEPAPLFDAAWLAGLESLGLMARRHSATRRAGGSIAAGRRVGDGLEFADHRAYQFGDDLRLIDWAAAARHGRLLVRRFVSHADRAVHVMLDGSASMAAGQSLTPWGIEPSERQAEPRQGGLAHRSLKFDQARRLAAAVAYLALNSLDRVCVRVMREGGLDAWPVAARGRGQIGAVLDYLAAVVPAGTAQWPHALQTLAATLAEPGLVVVVSDFLEAPAPPTATAPLGPYSPTASQAIETLAAGGHDLVLIRVLAPWEAAPLRTPHADSTPTTQAMTIPAGARVELTDAETRQTLSLTMTAELAAALAAEAAQQGDELAALVMRHRRGQWLSVMADEPLERLAGHLLSLGLVSPGA